jgi:quinoprotein glucose dehydrogenase
MASPGGRAFSGAVVAGLTLLQVPMLLAPAQQQSEWKFYGGDPGGARFSPLTQIQPNNVQQLQVAWRFSTEEAGPAFATRREPSFEATPLMVNGVLYFITPLGRVFAIDATTGAQKWVFDARLDRSLGFGDFASRGVTFWQDARARVGAPCRERIFAATLDARLFALDAANGRVCEGFGEKGSVNLRQGLRNPPFETEEYEVTSPPVVYRDLVIVGSAVADNNRTDAASGEVRAFDARSGALRWSWDPIPQDEGDPAYRTWTGLNSHDTGGANVWSVMAVDTARGLIFAPTSSPSPDYFGGERPGENRYGNSIVALRAQSGRVAWHFQTVHHDLWDYDNAAPPALTTVTVNGTRVPTVVQATKTGMLYVLDRTSGKPVFPVTERLVPASDVRGERAATTQPFSSIVLSPHEFTAQDVWGHTAQDLAQCREQIAPLRNQGIFTPPSLGGSLIIPSNIGGAHWGGVAIDESREVAIVPVNRVAAMVQLIPTGEFNAALARASEQRLGDQHTRMRGTPFVLRRRILRAESGYPCSKPPFGTLVAVDLKRGQILWNVPLGSFKVGDGPAIDGSVSLGGPIATAGGLVFIAATIDRRFRAFDTQTGRELWAADLPAGGKATPMTYMGGDGRQFVVIAAGGGEIFGRGDQLVAFALPRS